jgi:hypothetical protein
MALKAYEADATLDEIAAAIKQAKQRMDTAKQGITVAKSSLDGMSTVYAAFVANLDSVAAANPNNEVWQRFKDKKDLFVAEFGALQTYAANLKTAADGVVEP